MGKSVKYLPQILYLAYLAVIGYVFERTPVKSFDQIKILADFPIVITLQN